MISLDPIRHQQGNLGVKINEAKRQKKSKSIPTLHHEGMIYKSDEEKVNLFASRLRETFTDDPVSPEFDVIFREEAENFVKNIDLADNKFEKFSITELEGLIKTLKIGSTPEENNKLLPDQQSGFRRRRSTADNLIFVTQNIQECINRKKKVCRIFVDISKAIDKVWHDGLIYKLVKLKAPVYLLIFIMSFLKDRRYRISVNKSKLLKCTVKYHKAPS